MTNATEIEKMELEPLKEEVEPLEAVPEEGEQEDVTSFVEDEFEEIDPKIFTIKDVKEPLTLESLKNANYELGVVTLCWPDIEEPVFETRSCFPKSYYTQSNKERVLMSYAENFRRQLQFKFKNKKPILLTAPNECGMQKMVCTTVRPTKLCYRETHTWQGLASFVADYFIYEPLTRPMLLPERIISPYTCLVRRITNPFEMATVLVSWLVGSGFDAYVVVGCATRDTCMNIRYRQPCPFIPCDDEEDDGDEEPPEAPRYALAAKLDFSSKYVAQMAAKEAQRRQRELDKVLRAQQEGIDAIEGCPPDPIDGWRVHAWVLIVKGPDVEEPFFIEPAEGNAYPLSEPRYQRIDSIYNHENYYVNLQDCSVGLENLSYELFNLPCWEHLLAGEPARHRQMVGVDSSDRRTAVMTEKHLDMPVSWVERLEITEDAFEMRYPNSRKYIHFKKVSVELFSPYSETDGCVKRIQVFSDYGLTKPIMTYEWYENRWDRMEYVTIDYEKREIHELFYLGREDNLKSHKYTMDCSAHSVQCQRILEFYYVPRLDQLSRTVCTPTTYLEEFTDRDDRLLSRMIVYTEAQKPAAREVVTITECFGRNPDVPAVEDIAKVVFHEQDSRFEVVYHYGYNCVTVSSRHFEKPNLAETGGELLFAPESTSGYIADPNQSAPRPLQLFYQLCACMEHEASAQKAARDHEADTVSLLRLRHLERIDPSLRVRTFHTTRNTKALEGWTNEEARKAELSVREKEEEIDPLAPYVARLRGADRQVELTVREAALVREQCLNDFKATQLARQQIVQERFDKINSKYKEKKLWYLANQFILTPENEARYFAESAKMAFDVHVLEVRLTRHGELSAARFKILERILSKHPLLKEYHKAKHSHSLRHLSNTDY